MNLEQVRKDSNNETAEYIGLYIIMVAIYCYLEKSFAISYEQNRCSYFEITASYWETHCNNRHILKRRNYISIKGVSQMQPLSSICCPNKN